MLPLKNLYVRFRYSHHLWQNLLYVKILYFIPVLVMMMVMKVEMMVMKVK